MRFQIFLFGSKCSLDCLMLPARDLGVSVVERESLFGLALSRYSLAQVIEGRLFHMLCFFLYFLEFDANRHLDHLE